MISYLCNVIPSFLIEEILTKMFLVNFCRLLYFLLGDHLPHHPFLQDILKAIETGCRKFASSTFEVRIDMGCVFWVLAMVGDLKYKLQTCSCMFSESIPVLKVTLL